MRWHYILDANGNTIKTPSVIQWAMWFERASKTGERIIKQEQVGPVWVSTVFLGINHQYVEEGPPLLFETMVFDNDVELEDHEMYRYSTREEAEKGHTEVVENLKKMFHTAEGNMQWEKT